MKTINKIILGLALLSSSLIAEEVKLAWKGCDSNIIHNMYILNMYPHIRYNIKQNEIILNAVSSTRNDPIIVDRTVYNSSKHLYDKIYAFIHIGAILEYLSELDIQNKSIAEQNTLIDDIIITLIAINCMEVVE